MFGSHSFASRPIVSAPKLPRPYAVVAVEGEYGFAAWSYSRQAKLNAWSFHGLGGDTLYAWATLGNYVYVRKEGTDFVHALLPDDFYAEGATSTDSGSVEAVTQWLDFGKPGKKKALSGIDADCKNVTTIEIYVSEDGGRTGTLASSIAIGSNDGGWTYNGEVISTEDVGSATEFMLRFVCDGDLEAQINRVTLYFDEVAG